MRSSTRSWPSAAVAVMVLAAAALAACAQAGGSPTADAGTAPAVTGAWIRPPQGSDRPAGGYLVITGGPTDDALVRAASPAAGRVEIHQSTTDSSGMSGMHAIHRLAVPAGGTVELKPGGYHLMLIDVAPGAIEVGGTVQLELTFEKSGLVVVQAEVRAS